MTRTLTCPCGVTVVAGASSTYRVTCTACDQPAGIAVAAPDPLACGECGRTPGYRKDGSHRQHRTRADDPTAGYCPATPKGTR